MNEFRWTLLCLGFAVVFFFIGYIAGLSIPESIEFGLDEKTISFLEEYNNATALNCTCRESIDYNAPFNNSLYGLGGIQK